MKSFTAIALSLLLVFSVSLVGCFGEEDPMEPGEDVGIEEEWDDDYEADDDWEEGEDDFDDDYDDDFEDDWEDDDWDDEF